ncbi:GIY-YIG nuclease family protein [Patescibacteria group bacterium]|nr:GIY-YIG nuclease family protein [Patescibacteria group bacterium]MBU0964282.1 GIY-YIG nuclease family protein [Patescibacteria group bacterium]
MYTVYILKSQKDGRSYVGYSSNLHQRLEAHNSGKVLSTRNRRPLNLLYKEEYATSSEAKAREKWWKSYRGRREMKKFFN